MFQRKLLSDRRLKIIQRNFLGDRRLKILQRNFTGDRRLKMFQPSKRGNIRSYPYPYVETFLFLRGLLKYHMDGRYYDET